MSGKKNKIDGFNFGWVLESSPAAKWFYRIIGIAILAFIVYTCSGPCTG